jgi:hypothetical protein
MPQMSIGGRKRGWEAVRSTAVSLAGTSMSSPKFGSVVFDLTFLNEVSKQHETIKDIHAQVLDSCIAIISSAKFLFTSMRYPALNLT